MVKKCPVVINNDAVTVVDFDGIQVQLPSIKKEAKTVYVNHENGTYAIVDKKMADSADKPKKKNSTEKKTTKTHVNNAEFIKE